MCATSWNVSRIKLVQQQQRQQRGSRYQQKKNTKIKIKRTLIVLKFFDVLLVEAVNLLPFRVALPHVSELE